MLETWSRATKDLRMEYAGTTEHDTEAMILALAVKIWDGKAEVTGADIRDLARELNSWLERLELGELEAAYAA